MNCDWVDDGVKDDGGRRPVRCTRPGCGRRVASTPHIHRKIYAECRAWPRKWELGYWAAIFFSAFGITTNRVNWLKVKLGLAKCGCVQRQESLNRWGLWLRRLVESKEPPAPSP